MDNNKIHIILFGPPGSGKGTQAQKLVNHYGLYHISTGDLFRSETSQKTELGLKALEFMAKGQLVPDDVTIDMLRKKVASEPNAQGFIYDGFPRTTAQADALDRMLQTSGDKISCLIALDVSDDEIVKRILLRGQSSGRPDDSDESIIRKRMEEYRNKTSEVFDYYDRKGLSYQVSGLGSIEDIYTRLTGCIDKVIC